MRVRKKVGASIFLVFMRTALLQTVAVGVAGHGGMTTPLPRNSFGRPLDPHSRTGQILPKFFSNCECCNACTQLSTCAAV